MGPRAPLHRGADADVVRQAALLDLARLTLASDLARNYFELRTAQRQIRLAREDIAALEDRMRILAARARAARWASWTWSSSAPTPIPARNCRRCWRRRRPASTRSRCCWASGRGIARRAGGSGDGRGHQHGQGKGAGKSTATGAPALPDLALGLPSEVARRRPDIRAAEARLHRATANIGVAQADLYPSIRLARMLAWSRT